MTRQPSASTPLRVIVCEDEPVARMHLRELVVATLGLELVGEASDGEHAVRLIDETRPDVVFLDIRMPRRDGLAVLRDIQHQPAVVFTTAYDVHAVEAFELGAVDYLLKPFGAERFARAVERLLARGAPSTDTVRGSASESATASAGRTHLLARHRGQLIPVAVSQILRISADDDLVLLHVGGRQLALSETLGSLLEQLDPRQFIRVHRSHVVNLAHVASLEPRDANRLSLRMRDGSTVPASRAGTQLLRARLGRS